MAIRERYMVRGLRIDDGETWVKGLPHYFVDMIFIVSPEIVDVDEEYVSMEYWWEVDPATIEPVAVPVIIKRTGVGDYVCPNCNAAFIDGMKYTPYCGNCGQRLDWGKNTEEEAE